MAFSCLVMPCASNTRTSYQLLRFMSLNVYIMAMEKMIMGLSMSKKRIPEALIHFELYRLIANALEFRKNDVYEGYTRVMPEVRVGQGQADLVIYATMDDQEFPFLVIEVKAHEPNNSKVFDIKAIEQAREYALKFGAQYYLVTDGELIRLFSASGSKEIGTYYFKLDIDNVIKLINEIAEVHVGRRKELSFHKYVKVAEEIEPEVIEFAAELIEVIKGQLGPNFELIKSHGEVYETYSICLRQPPKQKLLSIALSKRKEPYIWLNLSAIRELLGDYSKYVRVMRELGSVPGFAWLLNKVHSNETWKYLRDVLQEVKREGANVRDVMNGIMGWIKLLH